MKLNLSLALLITLFCSCQSTTRDVVFTGHPLGDVTPANDHTVEITFAPEMVTGSASGTTLLGIFNLGPSHYSDGLVSTTGKKDTGLLGGLGSAFAAITSILPTDMSGKIKSAAVRDACDKAKCDLLGYPMYYVDEHNFFLWSHKTITVRGYPGKLGAMSNQKRPTEKGKVDLQRPIKN